jgi:hypothetical protein
MRGAIPGQVPSLLRLNSARTRFEARSCGPRSSPKMCGWSSSGGKELMNSSQNQRANAHGIRFHSRTQIRVMSPVLALEPDRCSGGGLACGRHIRALGVRAASTRALRCLEVIRELGRTRVRSAFLNSDRPGLVPARCTEGEIRTDLGRTTCLLHSYRCVREQAFGVRRNVLPRVRRDERQPSFTRGATFSAGTAQRRECRDPRRDVICRDQPAC